MSKKLINCKKNPKYPEQNNLNHYKFYNKPLLQEKFPSPDTTLAELSYMNVKLQILQVSIFYKLLKSHIPETKKNLSKDTWFGISNFELFKSNFMNFFKSVKNDLSRNFKVVEQSHFKVTSANPESTLTSPNYRIGIFELFNRILIFFTKKFEQISTKRHISVKKLIAESHFEAKIAAPESSLIAHNHRVGNVEF